MNLFTNALLNEECNTIVDNDFPEHDTVVSAILHTEDKDFYPNNVISLEEKNDYNELTGVYILTLVMGVKEYKDLLVSNRDTFQVSIYKNHNGKKTSARYKGVLVTMVPDEMDSDMSRIYTDNAVDGDLIEVEVQCVNFLYSVLKQISINTSINDVTVSDVMRYYLANEMKKVKLNNLPITPTIDIVDSPNTRKYGSIVLKSGVSLLDMPTYLQKTYGVYNGDIGTYVHNKDGKDLISIYPLYNTANTPTGLRLAVYISDAQGVSDLSNKTVLLDNDLLKIIVQTDVGRLDDGELADYDKGGGFKTTNSNQVLDRTYKKSGDKVTADSTTMIDSQSNGSKNDMSTVKMIGSSDNLYAIRSEIMKNKSKVIQAQWNFSRPDYLVPGMGVDIIRIRYGKIIREKAVLVSTFTKYDNAYRNSHTLLNLLIN